MNIMKKISLFVFAVFICVFTAFAGEQPEPGPWKVEVSTGILATQSSYSDNWTGGEVGSINWVAFYTSTTKKQLTRNWYNQYDWKLSFGETHIQTKDTLGTHWQAPQKSEDKIRFDGILKLTKGWFADPYLALTAESQFWDARNPDKPRYVNPLEVTETAGLAKTIISKPDKVVLTSRIGAGLRQRYETKEDWETTPGDTATVTLNTLDGGAEWVTDLILGSATSKYSFNSKLTVFQALFNSKSDEAAQRLIGKLRTSIGTTSCV
jgi:hypothetical protein